MSSTTQQQDDEDDVRFGPPFGMSEQDYRNWRNRKPPELQFWNELDLRRIRKIWQGAGATELEHTREHLRFAMPGGMPVTVTQTGITMPTLDREAIRASIETADRLWGGATASGDRTGQLWAAAYGQMLGVKVTTQTQFDAETIRHAVRYLRNEQRKDWQDAMNALKGELEPEPPFVEGIRLLPI